MKEFSQLGSTEDNKALIIEKRVNGKHLSSDAMAYYQQIALNMRIVRRNLNLTQQQVADAMKIPRSTYKSIESGKTGIYCYHLAKWSKITGYDVRLLTKGTQYDLTTDDQDLELVQLLQNLPADKFAAVLALIKTF